MKNRTKKKDAQRHPFLFTREYYFFTESTLALEAESIVSVFAEAVESIESTAEVEAESIESAVLFSVLLELQAETESAIAKAKKLDLNNVFIFVYCLIF